jgi:hypothetical protein
MKVTPVKVITRGEVLRLIKQAKESGGSVTKHRYCIGGYPYSPRVLLLSSSHGEAAVGGTASVWIVCHISEDEDQFPLSRCKLGLAGELVAYVASAVSKELNPFESRPNELVHPMKLYFEQMDVEDGCG